MHRTRRNVQLSCVWWISKSVTGKKKKCTCPLWHHFEFEVWIYWQPPHRRLRVNGVGQQQTPWMDGCNNGKTPVNQIKHICALISPCLFLFQQVRSEQLGRFLLFVSREPVVLKRYFCSHFFFSESIHRPLEEPVCCVHSGKWWRPTVNAELSGFRRKGRRTEEPQMFPSEVRR